MKYRKIIIILCIVLAFLLGLTLTYYFFPKEVKTTEYITLTERVDIPCINTDTSQEKPAKERFYKPEGIRPLNQQSYPTEPNIAYYEYSDGEVRATGSHYKNKPSDCALKHDRSLC